MKKFIIFLFLLLSTVPATADSLSAQVKVESREVFVGDPFTLQVVVSGQEQPTPPDLSHLKNFKVEDLGVSNSSSSNVTVINGQMHQSIQFQYIYSYRITPLKSGLFTIPSFQIKTKQEETATRSFQIRVTPPIEDSSFKLIQELSKKSAFIGEPLTLKITWFLASDAEEPHFAMPILNDKRFTVAPLKIERQAGYEYIRLPLATGHEVFAIKGMQKLNGQLFTTITFKEVVIPREVGELSLPQIVVTGKKITGYENSRQMGFFGRDPFFDDFFTGKQAIYKRFAIPSNTPKITVKALPTVGKPSNFSGLIGDYSIITNATPTEVNVGDPITLTIEIAGPDYLENVTSFPLNLQTELLKSFKIPAEMASPKNSRGVVSFTQTIRPIRADITAIPQLQLVYFDSKDEQYKTATSDSIPLKVSPAHIVTASDVEGVNIENNNDQKSPEIATNGIAYNYTDVEQLLANNNYSNTIRLNNYWIILAFLPCVIYIFILLNAFFAKFKFKQKRYQLLLKKLKQLCTNNTSAAEILPIFMSYLSEKFNLPLGICSFEDIKPYLNQQTLSEQLQRELADCLSKLEAANYSKLNDSSINSQLMQLLNKLESKRSRPREAMHF